MFPTPTPNRSITVFTTPRPMRLAILLDANAPTAIEDFDAASYYLTHLWGGQHSAIIPCRGAQIDPAWYHLLELMDPDCIYAVPTLDDEIIRKINRALAPAVLRHNLEANRDDGHIHFFGAIRDHPARNTTIPRVISKHGRLGMTPSFIYLTGMATADPYRAFIVRNFGALSETIDILSEFHNLDLGPVAVDTHAPSDLFATLAKQGNRAITPNSLSSYYSHPLALAHGDFYYNCFTVVVGDSIYDMALARAIRMFESYGERRSAWLPSALCNDPAMTRLLREFIVSSFWSSGNTQCQLVSISTESTVLTNLSQDFAADRRISTSVKTPDGQHLGFPNTPPALFVPSAERPDWLPTITFNLTKARQCAIVDRTGILDVQLPDFLTALSFEDQVVVDLELPFMRNEHSRIVNVVGSSGVWRLPSRQGLAQAFAPLSALARITQVGLPCVVLTARTERLPLRMPIASELLHCLTTRTYINPRDIVNPHECRLNYLHVSDEGVFLQALIRLFGSPHACGYVLSKPFWGQALHRIALGPAMPSDVTQASVRRGLAILKEREPSLDLNDAQNIDQAAAFLAKHIRASGKRARGLSMKDLRYLFNEMRSKAPDDHWYWQSAEWNQSGVERELDDLVEADILRMGVRVRCDECLTVRWVSVDEMSSAIPCQGCGAQVRLHAEPEWVYEVNTLAAEAIRRRGVVAVVQALYTAERNDVSRVFVALASRDVFESGSKQPLTDIDLLYIANREFVIGEVKADPSAFSISDLARLQDVAEDLLPNRVVLAAPGQEWPSQITEDVDRLSREHAQIGVKWEVRKLAWG